MNTGTLEFADGRGGYVAVSFEQYHRALVEETELERSRIVNALRDAIRSFEERRNLDTNADFLGNRGMPDMAKRRDFIFCALKRAAKESGKTMDQLLEDIRISGTIVGMLINPFEKRI